MDPGVRSLGSECLPPPPSCVTLGKPLSEAQASVRGTGGRAGSFVPAVEIKSGAQAKLLAHVPRNGALVMMTLNIHFPLGFQYLQLLLTPSPRKRLVFIKELSAPKQV